MFTGKPIFSKELEKMNDELNRLIRSHNMLCYICEVFEKNKTAKKYFDYSRTEVLDSGNQGLSTMYAVAIERMCEFIEDHQEDDDYNDVEKLHTKIYKLENENRRLNHKLQELKKLCNEI